MQKSTMSILSQSADIFETIRAIPIKEIIERYSPNPLISKGGKFWTVCPLHSEKTPSLSLKGNKWKCFGCQEGGDAVDFVAKLFGLSLIDAARMICRDFGLSNGLDKPLSIEQQKAICKRKRLREIEKVFTQTVDQAYYILCDVRIECCRIINETGPFGGFRYSHVPDMIDLTLDVLQFGTDEEKLEVLKSGEVEKWSKLLQ